MAHGLEVKSRKAMSSTSTLSPTRREKSRRGWESMSSSPSTSPPDRLEEGRTMIEEDLLGALPARHGGQEQKGLHGIRL